MSERTNFERTLLKMNRSKLTDLLIEVILTYDAYLDDHSTQDEVMALAVYEIISRMERMVKHDEKGTT